MLTSDLMMLASLAIVMFACSLTLGVRHTISFHEHQLNRRYLAVLMGIASGLSLACGGNPQTVASVAPVSRVVRPSCSGQFTGPGARPVSATTVANWYIKNGSLIYLVFLRGDLGWYNQKTQW